MVNLQKFLFQLKKLLSKYIYLSFMWSAAIPLH